MRLPFALLAPLVLASTASADVAVPGFKTIPREVSVEFAGAYPGWTFFVVGSTKVPQVPTTGEFSLAGVAGNDYATQRMGARVCAVPDELLAELEQTRPDREWFEKNEQNPRLRWVRFDPLSISTPVTDPRVRVTQKYRLTLTPTALEKELLSEVAEQDWTGLVIAGVVVAALAAGVFALGVWLVRKFRRRRTTSLPRE